MAFLAKLFGWVKLLHWRPWAALAELLRQERAALAELLRQERAALAEEMQELLRQGRAAIRTEERAEAQAFVRRMADELADAKAELRRVSDAVATLAPRFAGDVRVVLGDSMPPDALVWLAERQALTAGGGVSCKRCAAARRA